MPVKQPQGKVQRVKPKILRKHPQPPRRATALRRRRRPRRLSLARKPPRSGRRRRRSRHLLSSAMQRRQRNGTPPTTAPRQSIPPRRNGRKPPARPVPGWCSSGCSRFRRTRSAWRRSSRPRGSIRSCPRSAALAVPCGGSARVPWSSMRLPSSSAPVYGPRDTPDRSYRNSLFNCFYGSRRRGRLAQRACITHET